MFVAMRSPAFWNAPKVFMPLNIRSRTINSVHGSPNSSRAMLMGHPDLRAVAEILGKGRPG
jgi:hypothetical protein